MLVVRAYNCPLDDLVLCPCPCPIILNYMSLFTILKILSLVMGFIILSLWPLSFHLFLLRGLSHINKFLILRLVFFILVLTILV